MTRLACAALLLLAPFACDPSPVAPPIDAGAEPVPDAGVEPDGGVDPVPPCEGDGTCQVTWTESAPYPTPVDHHTTLLHTGPAGTFLHVAGGVNAVFSTPTDVYADVRRAPVLADGSLGDWESLAPVPRPLAFHGIAEWGGRVYLVAGITRDAMGPVINRATFVGDFAGDGTVSWRRGADVTVSSLHPGVAAVAGRLYVVGGTAQAPAAGVVVSLIGEDGLNGSWTAGPPLPAPRSHHAVVVRDGRMYLVGGFTTGTLPVEEIWRSIHDGAGALTGWELAGEIPDAPWTHAAFVKGEWLYVVGGGEGGPGQERYVDRVRRARFRASGTLNPFEDVLNPLPVERAHVHQTPAADGRVYSVGGRLSPSLDTMDRVFVGTFAQ